MRSQKWPLVVSYSCVVSYTDVCLRIPKSLLLLLDAPILLVSFAAVIRVVTQCSSPTNGCSLELYIPFLKLTNKDQASISWKPGPLAANVTRNMIGAAANSYMHVVGSQ